MYMYGTPDYTCTMCTCRCNISNFLHIVTISGVCNQHYSHDTVV